MDKEDIINKLEELRDKLSNAEIEETEVVQLWKIIDIVNNIKRLLIDSCWKNTKPK